MAEADGSGIVDLTTIEDSVYYLDPDEIIFHRSIVPIKFDGKNYFIWNIAMSTALKLRRKMGFVDGSIKEPANTDPNYKAWKRCNATVSLWLINSLAQPILEKMHLTGNAAELWKYLKSIYAIPYPGRMFYLQKQMFNFRQGNLSVSDYYSELSVMWTEYDYFRPIHECRCVSVTPGKSGSCCEAVEEMKKWREIDRLMCFVNGLDEDKFGPIKIQLTIGDPPDLDTAFNRVWNYERLLKLNRNEESEEDEEEILLFCRYCKQNNHVIEDCRKLKLKNKRRTYN